MKKLKQENKITLELFSPRLHFSFEIEFLTKIIVIVQSDLEQIFKEKYYKSFLKKTLQGLKQRICFLVSSKKYIEDGACFLNYQS